MDIHCSDESDEDSNKVKGLVIKKNTKYAICMYDHTSTNQQNTTA